MTYDSGEWERHHDGEAVLPMLVDSRGRVWGVTEGAGVFVFQDDAWRQFTTADGLLSDVVYDVAESGDGSIWFGTDQGASRLRPAD